MTIHGFTMFTSGVAGEAACTSVNGEMCHWHYIDVTYHGADLFTLHIERNKLHIWGFDYTLHIISSRLHI